MVFFFPEGASLQLGGYKECVQKADPALIEKSAFGVMLWATLASGRIENWGRVVVHRWSSSTAVCVRSQNCLSWASLKPVELWKAVSIFSFLLNSCILQRWYLCALVVSWTWGPVLVFHLSSLHSSGVSPPTLDSAPHCYQKRSIETCSAHEPLLPLSVFHV